jgi:hypothetical protein
MSYEKEISKVNTLIRIYNVITLPISAISTLFNARKEKARLEYEINGEDWMIDWIVGDTIWIILLLATGFILNDIIYIMVTS